jgi:amino acid transporter
METLAQSVSTIAPTTTPVATIPLVCALTGNGTWLAYLLATSAILLVALCVGKFARYSSSPGSLYTHASLICLLDPSTIPGCYRRLQPAPR